MKRLFTFVILLNAQITVDGFLNSALISSFFKRETLKYGVVLTCLNRKVRVKLAKNLTDQTNVLLSIKHMERLNEADLFDDYKKWGIAVDGDCPTVQNSLAKLSQRQLFDAKRLWLILHDSSDYEHLFEDAIINVNSNIRVAYRDESKDVFRVDDVYNPASQKGGRLRRTTVGRFDGGPSGYRIDDATTRHVARKNFSGVTFRATVVLPSEFEGRVDEHLRSERNVDVNTFNRFHAKLMMDCQNHYGFTMDVSWVRSWGYLQADGTLDGLVGKFIRNETDFGLSPLYVRKERLLYVDYGRRTWILGTAFILRNPTSRKSFEIFIKPFSAGVWTCTVIAIILSVSMQRMCYGLERKHFEIRKNADTSTWSHSLMSTCGAFCQQGLSAFPYTISGRTTAYVTLLLGLLIYQFYSASLVSFLLNAPTIVVKTPQDILDSGFRIGCEDVAHERHLFEDGGDSTIKEMYRRLIRHNRSSFIKAEQGLNLVKRGKYAFHVELDTGYPIIEKEFEPSTICELKEVYILPPKGVYAAYRKGSPIKDMLDVCLQKLSENGVLKREQLFWHSRKPECFSRKINIQTGIEEFYPALCILAFGMAFSLQVWTIEILWYRKNIEKMALYPYTE